MHKTIKNATAVQGRVANENGNITTTKMTSAEIKNNPELQSAASMRKMYSKEQIENNIKHVATRIFETLPEASGCVYCPDEYMPGFDITVGETYLFVYFNEDENAVCVCSEFYEATPDGPKDLFWNTDKCPIAQICEEAMDIINEQETSLS